MASRVVVPAEAKCAIVKAPKAQAAILEAHYMQAPKYMLLAALDTLDSSLNAHTRCFTLLPTMVNVSDTFSFDPLETILGT